MKMEEQIIRSISAPRILFKRTSTQRKCAWEIASSSSEDEPELKKIVEMIERLDKDLSKRFQDTKINKEGVENKD